MPRCWPRRAEPGLTGLPLYDEDFVLVQPAERSGAVRSSVRTAADFANPSKSVDSAKGLRRSGGPWSDKSGLLSIEALRGLPVLLLEEGHCLRDQTLEVCREAGAPDPAAPRAASLATLVQLVAGGLGVTLLPDSAAAVEARRGSGLTVARFADPPGRRIALVHRATSARSGQFTELAAAIRRAVRARRLPVRVARE